MAHRMSRALPSILQLLGLALLVAVCYLWHVLAGLVATGAALVLVGWLLDRPVPPRAVEAPHGPVS